MAFYPRYHRSCAWNPYGRVSHLAFARGDYRIWTDVHRLTAYCYTAQLNPQNGATPVSNVFIVPCICTMRFFTYLKVRTPRILPPTSCVYTAFCHHMVHTGPVRFKAFHRQLIWYSLRNSYDNIMLPLVCIIPAGRSRTSNSLGFPGTLPVMLSHRYPCKNMRCLPTITAAVSPCLPRSVYMA